MALNYSQILQGGGIGAGTQAINTAGALQGLRANRFNLEQAQNQVQAKEQAQVKDQENRTLAAELLTNGTPDQIAEFGIQNPLIMKDIMSAGKFKDEQAMNSRLNYAKNVLSGSVDPRKALTERILKGRASGGDMSGLEQTLLGSDEEIIEAARKDYSVIDSTGYLNFRKATGQDAKKDEGFTLGQGQTRFTSTGEQVASVAPKVDTTQQALIPQVLLEGLSPELSTKASAAYNAAGGGKDGMVAYQRQIDKGTEQEKRNASPKILKANFPQASDAEMAQLQGTMDAARTTETGLKAAAKVRVEQKRLVKAKGFQDRAVELLTKILDNDELGDVLGSIEGSYDFRLQDSEAELIADIEEAGNILTADNLSLMSGVLSESDIKILKNLAGGGLIRTRSEKRFTEDVTKLRDKLASSMVVTTDDRESNQNPTQNVDEQALRWANENPNDPRAAAILQKLGKI